VRFGCLEGLNWVVLAVDVGIVRAGGGGGLGRVASQPPSSISRTSLFGKLLKFFRG
jgi:hypothetical protein